MNKPQSNTRNEIVKHLVAGTFCSGEELGKVLGISRAGVAKHIKNLQELGLDIFSVSGRGYKLAHPVRLFDKFTLLSALPDYNEDKLQVLHVVDSTNDYLKQRIQSLPTSELAKGRVCLAEAQTAGRGRQGKKWVSPFGCSLYYSMYWEFTGGYQSISGLSLAVGVAVVRAIKRLVDDKGNVEIGLKWPNDIYYQGKKLAGILIDVEGHFHGSCQCIIGLGINIGLPQNVEHIDQPWTDLHKVFGEIPDKNRLAVNIVQELNNMLSVFDAQGLKPFIAEWNQLDIYREQEVKLISGNSAISGIAKGIDDSGALRLQMKDELGNVVTRSFFGGKSVLDLRRSLLVDIGNTRIKSVFCDSNGGLSDVLVLHNELEFESIVDGCEQIVVASVNNRDQIERFNDIAKSKQVPFRQVKTEQSAFDIQCPYSHYQKLGVDRWLCALAIAKRSHTATAIIDVGTAATCDFVVNGDYLGGWIAPGFQLMRQTLVNNTVNVSADEQFPEQLGIGTDTEECVNAGCLAMLNGFISQAEQKLIEITPSLSDYSIILSGGSAEMLARVTKNKVKIERDLVFQGLKLFI